MSWKEKREGQKVESLVSANAMPRHGVKAPLGTTPGFMLPYSTILAVRGSRQYESFNPFSTDEGEITFRYSYHVILLLPMGNNLGLICSHH